MQVSCWRHLSYLCILSSLLACHPSSLVIKIFNFCEVCRPLEGIKLFPCLVLRQFMEDHSVHYLGQCDGSLEGARLWPLMYSPYHILVGSMESHCLHVFDGLAVIHANFPETSANLCRETASEGTVERLGFRPFTFCLPETMPTCELSSCPSPKSSRVSIGQDGPATSWRKSD